MNIDFTKPVRTVSGTPVRILDHRVNAHHYQVVGLTIHPDGSEAVETWRQDGRYMRQGPSGMDLVNVQEGH